MPKSLIDPRQLGSGVIGAPIETQNPSGVSTVDFTTGIDSTFNRYLFDLKNITPATDQVDLTAEVSNDGGSSWVTSSSYRLSNHYVDDSGAHSLQANASRNNIRMTAGNLGSASNQDYDGHLWMCDPASSSVYTRFRGHGQYTDSGEDLANQLIACSYATAETIDAIRFKMDSGNIESGEISLYGIHS